MTPKSRFAFRPTSVQPVSSWLRHLVWIGLWCTAAQAQPVDLQAAERFATEHCGACHGATGQSAAPNFPRLAGQNPVYLVKQLKDFASGDRKSPTMQAKVALMDDTMIRSLAAYYSGQTAANSPSDDTQLMAVGQFVYERGNPYAGLPACASCHGPQGLGSETLPRLAGQHPAYLESQLRDFHDRGRRNDSAVMGVVSQRLGALEAKAVSTYLGALR